MKSHRPFRIETWTVLALAGVGLLRADPPKTPPLDYSGKVAIVFNENMPESKALAEFYAGARGIPKEQLVGLKTVAAEAVTRNEYDLTIEKPLREEFTKRGWWKLGTTADGPGAVENRIRILVPVYGIPTKIAEVEGPPGPVDPKTGKPTPAPGPAAGQAGAASVDSELTLLGLPDHKTTGPLNNPYFRKDQPFFPGVPPVVMLVGRLDGPSPDVCRRVVTDALATEKAGLWGKVYIDLARKGAGYEAGDEWLINAARLFGTSGWPVVIDSYPQTLPTNYPMNDAAVYLGWYVRGADGPFLNPRMKFRRGAIACHIQSWSAFTLRTPTGEWCGPLLAKGACGVLGNTWEPYLSGCANLDVFTDRLLKGYTFVEAAWMATPALSWMSVAVGDPLYRPFANSSDASPSGDNADYQILHSAVRRLSVGADKAPLFRELEAAATKRNSGALWEMIGLQSQSYYPNDLVKAAGYFEKAAKAYRTPAEQIRAYLQVPDLERRNDKTAGAVDDLRRIIGQYPKEPESEAARVWLNTIQPPAPK